MSLKDYPLVSDWLSLEDGILEVHSGKVDIGQRISTALIQVVHEETTLPHDRIGVAPVRTGISPDEGITSGSNSVEQSGRAVRSAAATLRRHLIGEAAERFGGSEQDWSLDDGKLSGPRANRPIPFLDLLEGMDLGIPVDVSAPFREQSAGTPRPPMRGLPEMVNGSFMFVHDIEAPELYHARVVRPPQPRARLRAIPSDVKDDVEAKGLSLVVDGSFVAVAGPGEWAVVKAARRLAAAIEWDQNGGLPENDVFEQLTQRDAVRLAVIGGGPSLDAEIPDPPEAPDFEARYERPFTMHGALAPSAAFATWSEGFLDIVTHSQGIYPLRESIADSLGLEPDVVQLTHMPGSGCYGHNGADDAAFEAALIARALPDRPILLKWTREDEHCWEPYGPAAAVEIAATLDDSSRIRSFSAEAISGTHRGRPRPGPDRAGPARLLANHYREDSIDAPAALPNMNTQGGMHRNLDPAYAFHQSRYVKNLVDGLPLRTSALRCLGAVTNVFAIETMMDEISEARGLDPLAFRRDHLDDDRAKKVLDQLERSMATLPAIEDMQGRGVAYAQYKNAMTRVGVCVDVEVTDAAELALLRALIVADAGRVVDTAGLEAQLEGGFLQAASWALHEEVSWDRDGILSSDWETYPVLRFDNVPEIDIIILDRPDDPAVGAGEASPGPTVAAIANAIAAATGLRMRRMPFSADALRRAAMEV